MSEVKTALVTGASKGIGAATALALGRAGFRVAVHYRSGEQEAKDICSKLENSLPVRFDLSKPESCDELVKLVKDEFGRIDVLVNNAGMAIDQIMPMAKPEDFDRLIDVNLKPVFRLSKLAAKQMIRQKAGRIINITSVVGHTGNMGQGMYAATKGAITSLTKSMAKDLARFGILCNCIAPGFIATQMTETLPEEAKKAIMDSIPMARMGSPEEVAEVVSFLSSQGSYITGSTIHVNGGMY